MLTPAIRAIVFPQTKSASKSAAFSLDAVCGADQSCKSRAQRLCA
jgi:hypothetical protein